MPNKFFVPLVNTDFHNNGNWSLTSGGAGGQPVPDAADNVFFDANSGSSIVHNTGSATYGALNATGFNGTFSGGLTSAIIGFNGDFILSSTTTWTCVSQILFQGNSSSVDTKGVSMPSHSIGFSASPGQIKTLMSDLVHTGANNVNLTQGNLRLNSRGITTSSGFFSQGTTARTLDMNDSFSSIVCAGAFTTSGSSFAITVNSSTTITCGAFNVQVSGSTFPKVETKASQTGIAAFTCQDFTVTANTAKVSLTFNGNVTINGTFKIQGAFLTGIGGNAGVRTISANAISFDKADWNLISATGPAVPWTGNVMGDRGSNTNITFTTPNDRHWVGGTGNWDATAGSKWSNIQGGAGGVAIPTSANDVYFDVDSGAGTCTLSGARVCNNINFTGFTGTLAFGSVAITPSGNVTLGTTALFTFSGSGGFSLTAAATTNWTSNGRSFTASITVNGASSVLSIVDSLLCTGNFVITQGTLNTNDKSMDLASFQITSNSLVRSISLGASTIATRTFTGPSSVTNLTFNAGTSLILFNKTSASILTSSSLSGFYDISAPYVNAAATFAIQDNLNCRNLTVGGSLVTLTAAITVTCSGQLKTTGNAQNDRTRFVCSAIQSQVTVSAASVDLTNTNFMAIVAAGAAIPWSGTSLGDESRNVNINFTTPVTRYWVGGSGNIHDNAAHWASASGGSPNATMPLPQDSAVFDSNSFTTTGQSVNFGLTPILPSMPGMNWANVTNMPTAAFGSGTITIHGSLILSSPANMTISGTAPWTFYGSNAAVLNTAGQTVAGSPTITRYNGSLTLQSDFIGPGRTINLNGGTFNTNGFQLDFLTLTSGGVTATRNLILGSSLLRLTGSWNGGSLNSVSPGTSIIELQIADGTARTFNGGPSLTYNILRRSGAGAGITTISVSNTFDKIEIVTPPAQINFAFGTTQTVRDFTGLSGAPGSLNTLNSNVAASRWNVQGVVGLKPVQNLNYINLKDSAGMAPVIWNAGLNSVDQGNNTGWVFSAPIPDPVAGGAMVIVMA